MSQEFVQNVSFVSNACCKCFYLNVAYVANVYFRCFRRILQLFHLSVAKVDLNVRLFSEGERASAGAMAASAVS